MVREAMEFVKAYDPELGNMIEAEYKRQQRNIELIASENIVSEAVMAAMGSVLTNKYAEGYPGKRYYGGCECVDVVETSGRSAAPASCSAQSIANVQPHSRRAGQYGGLSGPLQAGRHRSGHEPGQWRPPDPRLLRSTISGQLLPHRFLRRRRRTATSTMTQVRDVAKKAAAEDDHRRRFRLSACH